MIIIESLLYCDKLANFGIDTRKPELYLLSFGCFYLVWNLKKQPNDNKYNSGLYVSVLKFTYLSQQYNETSIIIIYNCKNLILQTGLVLSDDQ